MLKGYRLRSTHAIGLRIVPATRYPVRDVTFPEGQSRIRSGSAARPRSLPPYLLTELLVVFPQPRDQPAPPRRSHQHRRRATASCPQRHSTTPTPHDHLNDFAEAVGCRPGPADHHRRHRTSHSGQRLVRCESIDTRRPRGVGLAQADDLTSAVEQRAVAVAGADCGVGLDEVDQGLARPWLALPGISRCSPEMIPAVTLFRTRAGCRSPPPGCPPRAGSAGSGPRAGRAGTTAPPRHRQRGPTAAAVPGSRRPRQSAAAWGGDVVVVFERSGALHGIGAAPTPPTEERCRDGNRQEGQAHR